MSLFPSFIYIATDLFRAIKGKPPLDLAGWIAVLDLSTKWVFDEIRKFAIEQIDTFTQPPMDRIELAFKCQVGKWLTPAYIQLCTRVASISRDEAERLGFAKYYVLSQVREENRVRTASSFAYTHTMDVQTTEKAILTYTELANPFN